MKRLFLLMGLLLLAAAGWWWQRGAQPTTAVTASLLPLLTEENVAGYVRALEPGAIQFPRDLGSHNDYQLEWWYYTGNLQGADGREFGYQLTFFRRALAPEAADQALGIGADSAETPASNWRTNQVYLAHFTVSDVANGAFYQQERFSRGGVGLAGAQAEPYRIWLEDWSAEATAPGTVRLRAQIAEATLDLTLKQTLPPVLHGDDGLSQKGPEPGNASYYYSLVQQTTEGTLRLQDETFAVTGVSWKDHEYGTSALSGDAVGWDWFSAQFADGSALMLGQIRLADGGISPYSAGTFVTAMGEVRPLTAPDIELTVTDGWRSPTSGATYPAGWMIHIPSLALQLTAVPLMPNQELTVSTIYWEGAAAYEGTQAGQPITGRGYIELTGYAGSSSPVRNP